MLPKIGDRVSLTGVHVVDTEGGHGWGTLHPAQIGDISTLRNRVTFLLGVYKVNS
jgi:hypothetical protein